MRQILLLQLSDDIYILYIKSFMYCWSNEAEALIALLDWCIAVVITADTRHEGEVQAATTSNKMELSRVTKDLDATKATLAQHKMSAETLNSQVCVVLILGVLSYLLLHIPQHISEKEEVCL